MMVLPDNEKHVKDVMKSSIKLKMAALSVNEFRVTLGRNLKEREEITELLI